MGVKKENKFYSRKFSFSAGNVFWKFMKTYSQWLIIKNFKRIETNWLPVNLDINFPTKNNFKLRTKANYNAGCERSVQADLCEASRISGARYHRVATYSVISGFGTSRASCSELFAWVDTDRASPKSHNCNRYEINSRSYFLM